MYDITRVFGPGLPVWPGDRPCEVEWTARRTRGDIANIAAIRTTVHVGTHADAPFHVLEDGATIDEIPLDAFLGIARVLDVVGRARIDRAILDPVFDGVDAPTRLLFRTGAWQGEERFPTSYPEITPDAAELLAERGIRLIGTDAPSVDPPDSEELPAHRSLLSAGIVLLENLLLDGVPLGDYELIALPLRLRGADASPVRAILRA